jgi:hypothetical protein
MSILVQLCATIFALALIASAFRYVFDPQGAVGMLKTVALRILAIVFGAAVLIRFAEELPHSNIQGPPLLGLLLVSLIAYGVREFRMRNTRKPVDNGRVRGGERTPVLPHHMEDNQ